MQPAQYVRTCKKTEQDLTLVLVGASVKRLEPHVDATACARAAPSAVGQKVLEIEHIAAQVYVLSRICWLDTQLLHKIATT